jgi:hypothetical protein
VPPILAKWLLQQAAEGTRSSALNSLVWYAVVLLAATIGALELHLESWACASLAILTGLCCVTILSSHIYLMLKNPDALRSERFDHE